MSDAYFGDGAAESCAIIEQYQDLTERCGQIEPIDASREISAAPAPPEFSSREMGAAADHGDTIAALLDTRKALQAMAKEYPGPENRDITERVAILTRNIDLLCRDPDDQPLKRQFATNAADLKRWLVVRQHRLQPAAIDVAANPQ